MEPVTVDQAVDLIKHELFEFYGAWPSGHVTAALTEILYATREDALKHPVIMPEYRHGGNGGPASRPAMDRLPPPVRYDPHRSETGLGRACPVCHAEPGSACSGSVPMTRIHGERIT